MGNLAFTYWSLHQFDKSVPLYEELLERREAKFGRQDPDTLQTVANLGVNYKDAGRLKEAIPLLEEAYGARRTLPRLRWVASPLAAGYFHAGRFAEAITLWEQMRDDQVKTLGADHPDTLTTLHNLAVAYKGRWASFPKRSRCMSR